jgi:hypothetical protein
MPFGKRWEAGGYESMLYNLLHDDLTGFDVRRVPVTDGSAPTAHTPPMTRPSQRGLQT